MSVHLLTVEETSFAKVTCLIIDSCDIPNGLTREMNSESVTLPFRSLASLVNSFRHVAQWHISFPGDIQCAVSYYFPVF